ncbi:hypothetical protein EPUS_00616 [Endocarpon pusillum Z07020]|uniref:Uncharacterized protein n=1 Tax=Endocarpon pusillum (strain Z07020 / HMAS-L-300199) TaxID=1263415 RepID=U1G2Z3_ENDPU|nr:uncharacterized protein EPUS_00616 [Endocarpon pusillum Z07020]ERF71627.1 hypothetical protein EPUS_00616 [Endocarpon pusillum Z07020]
MANKSLKIPHRCIAVLTVIQALLDKLGENRHLCAICKIKFEPANVLAIFGCCGEFYHRECAAGWLNSPLRWRSSLDTNTPPQFISCMFCTTRWHPRTFNDFFPPKQIWKRIEQMAGDMNVTYISAGVPPNGSSLVYAATYYGRAGVAVVVAELIGQAVDGGDLAQLFNDCFYGFKNQIPAQASADYGLDGALGDRLNGQLDGESGVNGDDIAMQLDPVL